MEDKVINEKQKLLEEVKRSLDNFFFNIRRVAQPTKCETNLGEGQFFLIFSLWEHGTCKVSDISVRLGLTAGAITSMADKLEEAGFVQRERSKADRRVVWLSLTDEGHRELEKVRDRRFAYLQERFAGLSMQELEKVTEAIGILNKVLE